MKLKAIFLGDSTDCWLEQSKLGVLAEKKNTNIMAGNMAMICIVVLLFLSSQVIGCPSRRRSRSPPRCSANNCEVGWWSQWGICSHKCGTTGVQTRTRSKIVTETCGGRCPDALDQYRSCNRYSCSHGGTPISGRCSCTPGWTGTCCEYGK